MVIGCGMRNIRCNQSKDCRFLDEGFRCSENGRPDFFYTKWRWQPRNCNLPRFFYYCYCYYYFYLFIIHSLCFLIGKIIYVGRDVGLRFLFIEI
ncbi:protein trichome birefringence-like 10 [Phtheirospermum japonicum]|uniref:Protein trichome birefringence-like 10 n=1 Tax=Phtheirospermum japonicum TaxID=374723 RepID=A0A830BGV6_9LAMI|nr:protein trichome birefringence-like 10 [Phtheirospermum japonicum]